VFKWLRQLVAWLPASVLRNPSLHLYFDCIVSRSVPQAITNMRKRVMGEPSRGVITMVNTDIEGYSGESRGF